MPVILKNKAKVLCPKCGARANRVSGSTWRDVLCRLLGRYPYKCYDCRTPFYSRTRKSSTY